VGRTEPGVGGQARLVRGPGGQRDPAGPLRFGEVVPLAARRGRGPAEGFGQHGRLLLRVPGRHRGEQRREQVIGAVASTIEEWREHIAAGRGISLCPASSETFSARPGIVFVRARGVPATSLCVAWRGDDVRAEVLAFVKVATGVGGAG